MEVVQRGSSYVCLSQTNNVAQQFVKKIPNGTAPFTLHAQRSNARSRRESDGDMEAGARLQRRRMRLPGLGVTSEGRSMANAVRLSRGVAKPGGSVPRCASRA